MLTLRDLMHGRGFFEDGVLKDPMTNRQLRDCLIYIRDNPIELTMDEGICGNINKYFSKRGFILAPIESARIRQFFMDWPQHSGNRHFPVPDPDNPGVKQAEVKYMLTCDMWNQNTEYGQLRMTMLEYCINRMKRWEMDHEFKG